MSEERYPLAATSNMRVVPVFATAGDEMADGRERTRRDWPEDYVKHTLTFDHIGINQGEFDTLLEFLMSRGGKYEDFWYRANVNRLGNMKVRFTGEPAFQQRGQIYDVRVSLRETTARYRQIFNSDLPDGLALECHYDANKQRIIRHQGADTLEAPWYDSSGNSNDGSDTTHATPFESLTSQWTNWEFDSAFTPFRTETDLEATFPSYFAVFGVWKAPTIAANTVLMCLGSTTAGESELTGLMVNSSNEFTPISGAVTGSWTNAKYSNATDDTWRTFAVVFADSGSAALYVNGALIGTDTPTAYFDGGMRFHIAKTPTVNHGVSNCVGNHFMCGYANWTLANIEALHNLVAPQYGLDTV